MARISDAVLQGLMNPRFGFTGLAEPIGMLMGGAQAQRQAQQRQMEAIQGALGAQDIGALQKVLSGLKPDEVQNVLAVFSAGQQQRTAERARKRQVATELEQESDLINARLDAQQIARSLGKPELANALKSAPMESVQRFIQASYEAQAKTTVPKVNSVPGGYTTTYPDGKVVFTASGETAEKATMPKVTSVVGGYTTTYPDGKVVFTETAKPEEEEEKVAPLDLPPEINATETTIIEESLANASTATTRAAMARRGLEILSTRGKVRGPLVALRSKVLGLFGSRDELDTAYQDVGSMFKDEALQAYLPRPGAISNFELQWAEQQSKDPTTLNDKELDFFLNRKIDIEEARARYNQDKASHISKYGTNAGFNDIVMLKRSEQKIVELKKTEEYKVLDQKIFSNPDLSPASKAKALDKMKKNPEYADIIAQAEAAGADFKMYSERVNSFEARYKTKR